jgi:unsaturated rhamnogalacturonyl hydrolase
MPVRYIIWLLFTVIPVAGIAAEPGRPPMDVARELLEVYGRLLDDLVYIPAVAVHCRWRFADLMGEQKYADEVRALIDPYSRGEKTAKTDSHVAIAGHLAFVGLHEKHLIERIAAAAERVPAPQPEEMSDAVFMCGPILCEAARLTKDDKYFHSAVGYLAELRKLRQRKDGLYAHGHLCDAAWGRGNGFPAVGVAWCLTALPEKHDGRPKLLDSYRAHMQALLKHQDDDGMWHQVIDVAESKPEFTCTCMIGFAMQRGITYEWLAKEKYQPAVDKAWQAIGQRIKPEGKLIGVCEGTGTQPTVEAYLGRKLNDGVDQRGGAMALLFATEMMARDRTAK